MQPVPVLNAYALNVFNIRSVLQVHNDSQKVQGYSRHGDTYRLSPVRWRYRCTISVTAMSMSLVVAQANPAVVVHCRPSQHSSGRRVEDTRAP